MPSESSHGTGWWRPSLVTMAFLILSGCGGGISPCPVEAGDRCYTTHDYRDALQNIAQEIRSSSPGLEDRWAMESINLAEAWAHLRLLRGSDTPGEGVSVGVIDTGIDLDHPVFMEGAAAGEVTEELLAGATEEFGEDFSHGTGVASIIVGRENPVDKRQYSGIAPYATLKMFAVPLSDPPPPGTPFDPVELSKLEGLDEYEAEFFADVLSRDIDILNMSFGVEGLVENYGDWAALRTSIPRTIEALAQADRDDKVILVWAAGNSNGRLCVPGSANCVGADQTDHLGRPAGVLDASSASFYSGLAAHLEELRGHSIAVVATDEEGGIAQFSNRCGIVADWCIAAPGHLVRLAYFGPYQGKAIRDFARASGTSFAAPMVSGSLALMKQLFRDQLPNEEVVARLFHTADSGGRFADRSIYGHGMMDLNTALSPVGGARIPAQATVVGAGMPVVQSSLQLGEAFGDGLASALARHEVAGFDALGAPFCYDLGHLIVVPPSPDSLAHMREFLAAPPIDAGTQGVDAGDDRTTFAPRFGLGGTPGGTDMGHALLARDALSLTVGRPDGLVATAFTTDGVDGLQPASGVLVSWQPTAEAWGLRAGWLGERRGVLSATAEGAFGNLDAHSMFLGVEIDRMAGK